MNRFWQGVADEITRATGRRFTATAVDRVGGGCIHDGYLLSGVRDGYFVKTNDEAALALFICEADGLTELASPGVLGVPRPVCYGVCDCRAFLAMESINIGEATERGWALLGEGLARLHQTPGPQHGWRRDNFIGATPQPNGWSPDWVEFLRSRRLGHQLKLAAENGFRARLQSTGERLLARLGVFFSDYRPQPSLLHGDLWSGNCVIDIHGNPFIFDPAVHYGDRESDIAMTELFGGFAPSFYAAYNGVAPLDAGYSRRRWIYRLYHVLNHANLFGGGYPARAQSIIDRLLAETG